MKSSHDNQSFFINKSIRITGKANGPLANYSFAVKDVFDIAGCKVSVGNPDWFELHKPARKNATIIQILLNAGATLIGTTNMTEFTRGTFGENVHYGMPSNPLGKEFVPGGSSSGSACVVAAGIVDFSLGTDTIGSIRVPASFCGLYGFRPSLNRIPAEGVWVQSPGFDTVGLLTKDPELLVTIGQVIFNNNVGECSWPKTFIAKDLFAIADREINVGLQETIELLRTISPFTLEFEISNGKLERIFKLAQVVKGYNTWKNIGNWMEKNNPRIAFHVAKKFVQESLIGKEDAVNASIELDELLQPIKLLLNDNVVILPTTASTAWTKEISTLINWSKSINVSDASNSINRTNQLLTIASVLGAPQVCIPIFNPKSRLPLSISILGSQGSDEKILSLAQSLAKHLNQN